LVHQVNSNISYFWNNIPGEMAARRFRILPPLYPKIYVEKSPDKH